MSVEVFFVPADGVATLTPATLQAALEDASMPPKVTVDGELLWIEFHGFESRLLTSPGDAPLELITLQFYGDAAREDVLLAKLATLLESHGYCDGESMCAGDES